VKGEIKRVEGTVFIELRNFEGKYFVMVGFKYINAVIARTRAENFIIKLTICWRMFVCAPALDMGGNGAT
jgi:hypothetical protein